MLSSVKIFSLITKLLFSFGEIISCLLLFIIASGNGDGTIIFSFGCLATDSILFSFVTAFSLGKIVSLGNIILSSAIIFFVLDDAFSKTSFDIFTVSTSFLGVRVDSATRPLGASVIFLALVFSKSSIS